MSEIEIEVGKRHIREINQEIQEACKSGKKIRVVNTLSRHNLGVGLPDGADITFEGSVGYYCGGLNTGSHVTIERNCGWAVGEGMAKGHITVGGYAGMSCGAAMIGGTIHVKGDAGPRCGVAMKAATSWLRARLAINLALWPILAKSSRWAARVRLVPMLFGKARFGSLARLRALALTSTSSNPPPKKWPKWMQYLIRLALKTHRAIGAKWFRANAFGILKVGTQAHGS